FPAIFLAELVESFGEFFAQLFDVGLDIPFFIRHFETTSKINELQIFEIFGRFKQNFGGVEENIDVQNIASRVHVDAVDVHFGQVHNTQQVGNLVYADPEF